METIQIPLICETYADAIAATIVALGGNKTVGAKLWPSLPADEAGHKLAHCLRADRRELLTPDELALLRSMARQANVNTMAAYEMRAAGYADPQPIEPEDERAALQRQFIETGKTLKTLLARMERAGLRVA